MVFAYGGFESMVIAASETRDPRRDTALALIAAGAIVTLMYCLLQIVIVGVLPDAGHMTTPIASALRECSGRRAAPHSAASLSSCRFTDG